MRLSRRDLIRAGAALVPALRLGPAWARSQSRAIAGAIRWDAWYERADYSIPAQESLSPERYHERAPSHCSVISSTEIACLGSQDIIDREILAAVRGGLKFWAFDRGRDGSSFRAAWNLYQTSRYRDLINWCGVVPISLIGSRPFSNDGWRAKVAEWVVLMQQPCYQKVDAEGIANRPVLFILWYQRDVHWYFDDNLDNLKLAFEALSAGLKAAGLGKPYVVILDGVEGAPIAKATGAAAISNYISGFRAERTGPYQDLDRQTRAYWTAMAATGTPIVPIAMVGWDVRSKLHYQFPWEPVKAVKPDPNQYYVMPNPDELKQHISAAMKFIERNPEACPSKLLLIYSWDECAEGGGLIPTLGDPSGKYLSALATVLK